VVDARARLTATGALFRDVNAAVRLRGDTVLVDSLAGRAGPARCASPAASASRPRPSRRSTCGSRPATPACSTTSRGAVHADAQISVYGPFDRVFVSGGARVLGGVIYIPESDSRQTLAADDPAVFAVIDTTRLRDRTFLPSRNALLENLRVDLLAGVDRDTWVRSREANVEIHSDGDLRLRVDQARQALVLDGIVLTDRGEYTFLGKRFQIKRGAVTFVNTQELDPDLQLTAEYEVAQAGRDPLNIQIQVGGSLSRPARLAHLRRAAAHPADGPVQLPRVRQQHRVAPRHRRLHALRPSGDGSNVGAAANVATKRLAGTALGILVDNAESGLGRSLGADVINVTPGGELAPELATQSGLENFIYGTQFEFGKYFNRQLFVGVQTTPNFVRVKPYLPGFRVQYRFARTPGLSLEAVNTSRFFLLPPTLGDFSPTSFTSYGLYLVRQWRF
jgi:hypothetical protein